MVSTGVWHLLEGTARDQGLVVAYDEPLPFAARAAATGVATGVQA